MFFENGFSSTTCARICQKAGISAGNLTFYFPTKEHILTVIVKMLLDFQWDEMKRATNEGSSSLLTYCLELATMTAVSEKIPQTLELFIASYTHQMTLELIRKSDMIKMKQVFADYTDGWDDEKFRETESIVSGIEYATIMHTENNIPIERRISSALDAIMMLFGVPEQIRKTKISKVLAMNYHEVGMQVYEKFEQYVIDTNEQALEAVLNRKKTS